MLEFAGTLALLLGFLFALIAGYAMLRELEKMAVVSGWTAIFFTLVSISLKLGG